MINQAINTLNKREFWEQNLIDPAKELYHQASIPGERQRISQAAMRSFMDIAALYTSPASAITGGLLACCSRDTAEKINRIADTVIDKTWNSLSFNGKVAVTAAVGCGLLIIDPTSLIKTAGTLYALKLGADIGLKHSGGKS